MDELLKLETSLDVLVRLVHPEWFALLCEYCRERLIRRHTSEQHLGNIVDFFLLSENIYCIFGAHLLENLDKNNGLYDPSKWWRQNIVEIAECSDNELVLELAQKYK